MELNLYRYKVVNQVPIVKIPFQPFSSSFILNSRLSPNITLMNISKTEMVL